MRHHPLKPETPRGFEENDLAIAPIERSQTIPSAWYTQPDYLALDNAAVFSRTWQPVGYLGQLEKAGDYLLATVADDPIIVIRGKDLKLRAFFNVCRHRGGPISTENGTCKVMQCQYHGWTYLLDGSLRGVPEFDRVELFDKKDYGLIPVLVETWENLVFVNLSAKPVPLREVLHGIIERIAPNKLGTKSFVKRVSYSVACNWKVYVDNYLEGYHLPYVHPELCNLLDYQRYVTETDAWHSLQYSPLAGDRTLYGSGDGAAFYYFVWPNFMMNILPGRLQTNLILAVDHENTNVIFDYYYDDAENPHIKKMIEADIEYSDGIQVEDIEICEEVQKGLSSRAYDRGRFSVKCEQGVYHFQTLLKRAYAMEFTTTGT